DRNRSHWSTSKTPSYTKSVSWHHHPLPLLGIALMAYSGKSWSFLGCNVSPFVTPNSEIKALIKNIHETWANIGYFLIAAHAGAALFHHYIQKDNTLLRMMPRRK
ncbi:cytochrome b, partial [Escherichia coli]|uniref:cytochrome b n=1 Tax=Escherichia coli TaxID=562 RepID=UPI003CFAF70E